MGAALLHSNAGAFERAAAEAMTDELPVPIREIMDPARTPSRFLPFLAAHRSVDLWFEDWSQDRKRAIIADWPKLASLVGARAAPPRLLAYVDAELVDALSHPHRPLTGRYPIGRVLLGHPAFRAIYLVKTATAAPKHGYCVGRHPVGRRPARAADFKPVKRALEALRQAKAPETEILVDFANYRPLTAGDAIPAGSATRAGQYLSRNRLGRT
ncbi:phage tail protein I [Devosia sp. 1635]|uniref:phage tail protein I n=1 Tax=Devosia sp. 1635 TaxID=2726066 RepID=UPI0015639A79|nr:phage tail protein I [Devosia sp. 1635]